MKKVIAYSGGVDSTARAIALLRDHPDVEFTLCFVDMGQTSAAAQLDAMVELAHRYPAFSMHVITIDAGFNPTTVTPEGVVLQNGGVLPFVFSLVASYARYIGAEEVVTGYDRWSVARQNAYDLITHGTFPVDTVPINHFGDHPLGIAGTLAACGLSWPDVAFSVSCAGDPSDPLNPAKVPCGVCSKCKAREAFNA